jgi:transcriptional regulator with XRE-family HTH domain
VVNVVKRTTLIRSLPEPPGRLRTSITINIRAARAAKGLTQIDVAEMAGLQLTYIGAIERTARNLSIDNLQRIAAALGMAPQDLVRYDDKDAS